MSYQPTEEDLKNPCGTCNLIFDGISTMGRCFVCKKWHHEKCQGENKVPKKGNWSCLNCKKSSNEDQVLILNKKLEELMLENLKLKEEMQAQNSTGENSAIKRNSAPSKGKENPNRKSEKSSSNEDTTSDSESDSNADKSSDEDEESDSTRKTSRSLRKYLLQQETKDLPKFDGCATQWPSFYKIYKETEKYFSNVANRNRLLNALSGSALRAVQGLLLSPATINEAIKLLKFRFGQSEHIIQQAINEAMEAESPSEKNPQTIIEYAMLILSISSNIKAVGNKGDKLNPMLIKTLAGRLPFGLQKKWNQNKLNLKRKGKNIKIDTFSRWLLKESEVYIDMVPIAFTDSRKTSRKSVTVNLHQDKIEKRKQKVKSCYKCFSENHFELNNCDKFKKMSLEERKNFIQKKGMCYICLKKGHVANKCYRKSNGTHNLLREPKASPEIVREQPNLVNTTLSHHEKEKFSMFKILPVTIYGPSSQFSTYALLDECASVTLIEEEIAEKMNLPGKKETLEMGWTQDIVSRDETSRKVRFKISGSSSNGPKYDVRDARTVKRLSLPKQQHDLREVAEHFSYLKDADLPDITMAVPTILLGLDNANLIVGKKLILDPNGEGPIATQTKLGWTVHGREVVSKISNVHPTFVICDCKQLEERVDNMVEKYFEQEDFGIKVDKPQYTHEDQLALETMKKTTRYAENCYETGLLWRRKGVIMPNNYKMCLRRLVSVESKIKKDQNFGKAYQAKIKEYVEKGYARKLTNEEVQRISDNMWLLPHFGVSTVNKPKLRLVFDAKATFAGVSLNSQLLSGPDQYNSIVGVLFKFREGEFAVAADIKEMFHRIKIREEDRRFQCFLWRDGDDSKIPEIYMMIAMIFGATCSPCSAQYIKNENAARFEKEHPRAVEAIRERFYVDDYMDSFADENEAMRITKKVIEINSTANFELRNVISNSVEIMKHLGTKIENPLLALNPEQESTTEKVLGLFWDIKTDNFVFSPQVVMKHLDQEEHMTKRAVLKILMSIFDPLGLLAHYVVRAKILLQDIWIKKDLGWDVNLPIDLCNRWKEWMNGLKEVNKTKIPRNYFKEFLSPNNIQLHIFVDASERAYAAVAYARIQTNDAQKVALISAKSKVPSLKSSKVLSIPRLELQAAVLGIRLCSMIQDEHSVKFKSVTFWSDSQTVLSWIRTEYASFKPFVAHRISEILNSSNADQWRYISSKNNPADLATKITKDDPFNMNTTWYKGPIFLWEPERNWSTVSNISKIKQDDPELRRLFVTIVEKDEKPWKDLDYSPINPEMYSDWHKMIRRTAWIKRKLYNFNHRRKGEKIVNGPLLETEIQESKNYFIKKCQRQSYYQEMKALLHNKPVPISSKIKDLIPFLDKEGVMRMDGRLEQSPVASYDMKKPIILDPNHPVTKLILKEYHEKCKHQFQEEVVNEVRQKYWIPKLRLAIKGTKRRCQVCKNNNAQPIPPKMSKLPAFRVEGFSGCFRHTGVDLFGPMGILVKRSIEKRWGVVFTCLNTRAVYIDLVPDLTADSLILAIRNCNSRRGPIDHLYSDCGTNMKGAESELRKALYEVDEECIQRECIKNEIKWHFNPPASPHMGGCWERMVRSIKSVLNVLLKEKHPKEHTIRSFLCEVEDIINRRPLTYIALERDSDDAITPKHFLNPYFRSTSTPLGEFDKRDLLSRKQWRQVQELSNHFWKRWVAEYLPMLSRTSKWHEKVAPLEVDDIVIICDNTAPRNSWEKGRIIEVQSSSDGQVRSAKISTQHGILTRPTVKLAKLDVKIDNSNNSEKSNGKDKGIKISNLLHILLCLLCITNSAQASLKETGYELHYPAPGLYIENLGQVKIRRGNFRIEFTLPEEEIINAQKNLSKVVEDTRTFCSHVESMNKDSKCMTHLKHLENRKNYILEEMSNIITIKTQYRRKRGLLGKTLTAIFGVNDEVYSDLDQLHSNQKNLWETMKHQNLLLSSKVNEISEVVNHKFDLFRKRMEDGLESIRYMQKWSSAVDRGLLEINVHSIYICAENYIDEIEEEYRKFSNVINNRGNIIEFMNINKINNFLKNKISRMPTNLKIYPTPQNRIEIQKINSTIKVFGYFYIIENEIHNLIHVTPIPNKVGDAEFAIHEIKTPDLAINYNGQSYFELSQTQLQECIKESDTYLCCPTMVSNMGGSSNCVIDEIYEKDDIKRCPIVQLNIENILWKQLKMANTWMFVSNRPTSVAVICHGERNDIKLNGTGILRVDNNCIIKTKSNTFRASIDQNQKIKMSYHKELLNLNTSLPTQYKLKEIKEHVLDSSDLLQTIHLTEEPKDSSSTILEISKHSTTAGISVLTSLSIGFIIYKFRKRISKAINCLKKRRETEPNKSENENMEMKDLLQGKRELPEPINRKPTHTDEN